MAFRTFQFLLLSVVFNNVVWAFTVYDCRDTNKTTWNKIDVTEPAECPEAKDIFDPARDVRVQILQAQTDRAIKAYKCSISITREVCRCGFDSLNYGCQKPTLHHSYILAPNECRKAVRDGILIVEGQVLDIQVGVPGVHQFYSHGSLDTAGNCHHEAFTTNGIYFDKSYERTELTYLVDAIRGRVDSATQTITFSNGLYAKFQDEVLRDSQEGTLVWEASHNESCYETFSEVFLGQASHYLRKQGDESQGDWINSIVMVNTSQQYAALLIVGSTSVCSVHGYLTQIKGLVLVVLRPGDAPLPKINFHPEVYSAQDSAQADLAYLHLSTNMAIERQFAQMWKSLCEADRTSLFNKLNIMQGHGNRNALLESHGPGHPVYTKGDIAYVGHCAAKEAVLHDFENCTEEIPVLVDQKMMFAHPSNFLLQDFPTIIPCDSILPVGWKIGDIWYCSTPSISPCIAPPKLQPGPGGQRTRTFGEIVNGLNGGLYSQKQAEQHHRYLVAADSRRAILSKAAFDATNDHSNILMPSSPVHLRPPLSSFDIASLKEVVGRDIVPFFNVFGIYGHFIVTLILVAIALGLIFSWLKWQMVKNLCQFLVSCFPKREQASNTNEEKAMVLYRPEAKKNDAHVMIDLPNAPYPNMQEPTG